MGNIPDDLTFIIIIVKLALCKKSLDITRQNVCPAPSGVSRCG